MLRMAVGHSNDPDAADAAAELLAQCRTQLGDLEPGAAILFAANDMDHQELLQGILGSYPRLPLIGGTAAGEFSSVLGYQEDSATLAMFASDSIDLTVGVGRNLSTDPAAACREAVAQATAVTNKPPALCFALPDSLGDPAATVANLADILGPDVALLGGGSSAVDLETWKSNQFAGSEILEDALAILLFSGPLKVSAGVATGWKPLGKAGTVTRSEGNLVYEIDGEPALDFFKRYLGEPSTTLVSTPLAVFDSDSDEYYLRGATEYDRESGVVRFFGTVPEQARVRIATTSTEEILGGAAESFAQARSRYPEAEEPEAALLVSCAVRKMLLGGRTGEEMDRFKTDAGSHLPVCGFYAYGEIGPLADGKTHFHNTTIVTVLLGT